MQKSKLLFKKIFKHTAIQPQNNYKIKIIGKNNIIVSNFYHEKANRNFLRHFTFKETIKLKESCIAYFLTKGFFYKKIPLDKRTRTQT